MPPFLLRWVSLPYMPLFYTRFTVGLIPNPPLNRLKALTFLTKKEQKQLKKEQKRSIIDGFDKKGRFKAPGEPL